jgi:hypothetical protein
MVSTKIKRHGKRSCETPCGSSAEALQRLFSAVARQCGGSESTRKTAVLSRGGREKVRKKFVQIVEEKED